MAILDVAEETVREALPILVVGSAGGLIAGLVLSGMNTQLRIVQGLLVMIPAFLAIRGSVYGALGSRLSSALHQGLIDPQFRWDDRVIAAMMAAVLNGLLASLFAAGLAFGVLTVFQRTVAPLLTLLGIALVGGLIAGAAMLTMVVLVVFTGYRRGVDPDYLVGPTVTIAGDIFGMLSLYLATRFVLWIR